MNSSPRGPLPQELTGPVVTDERGRRYTLEPLLPSPAPDPSERANREAMPGGEGSRPSRSRRGRKGNRPPAH